MFTGKNELFVYSLINKNAKAIGFMTYYVEYTKRFYKVFNAIVITFYSPSCFGQETAKWSGYFNLFLFIYFFVE